MPNLSEAMPFDGFHILEVDWHSAQAQLNGIRTAVFIQEQHVPAELEWDGCDLDARHLLASDPAGKAIGCARVLSRGHIGRMAVLAEWRRQGVGSALLLAAIELCRKNGWHDIMLSAQTHAIAFYEKSGFVVCSEEYLDAGIPHHDMRTTLTTNAAPRQYNLSN